jgi:hypothetical protein
LQPTASHELRRGLRDQKAYARCSQADESAPGLNLIAGSNYGLRKQLNETGSAAEREKAALVYGSRQMPDRCDKRVANLNIIFLKAALNKHDALLMADA